MMESPNKNIDSGASGSIIPAKRRYHDSMRLPLKETTSNIPSPVLKKAKLIHAKSSVKEPLKMNLATTIKPNLTQLTNERSTRHKPNQIQQSKTVGRLAGEELFHWQQSWKKIMKESTVYFEGVTEYNPVQMSEFRRASKYLKQVGCEITPFYDNDVTIIISRRTYLTSKTYPSNDIFSNVSHLKIKVWDYDKVFRFLKNLGINISDESASSAVPTTDKSKHKDNLYNLLKEEKIYGSTDRDPNAKRDDLHYLEKNYLYVYDLSQKVRPIAIREWQDENYPVLNLTLDGKCPFIFDSSENSNNERKKLRRLQKFEATKSYRNLLRIVTYDIMNNIKNGIHLKVSGFSGTSTSTDRINEDDNTITQNSLSSKNKKTDEESYKLDQELQEVFEDKNEDTTQDDNRSSEEEETTQIKPTRFKEPLANMIPLTRYSSCIQPSNSRFFDVAASGYNGASNAANFSMDSNLHSGAQGNGLGPMVSQVPSRNLTNLKNRIIMKKQQQKTSHRSDKEKDMVSGYCENCRIKYDHFDDHIKSNRHRNFACDDRNFKDIDNLIATLNESKSLGYVTSNGDFKYA